MLEEAHDDEQIIERVAALDIGKAELVCCTRVPKPGGRGRLQEVSTWSTMTRALHLLGDRLVELGVTRVVMEATSDYWKPAFYALEAHEGLEVWVVNAREVKHLPGRPKTDVADAVWLCRLAERQMLRPSFVPPSAVRELRALTRYRVVLVGDRTAEKNRVEKLLEDAQIKVSVVASDIFGVSGRAMLDSLVAGQRDPLVLAEHARGPMRRKITDLREAFTGNFTARHAFLLRQMLRRIDALEADIGAVEAEIDGLIADQSALHTSSEGAYGLPFRQAVTRLVEIPGFGRLTAIAVLAEIGLDMSRFPTAAHLASWAKVAPGIKQSAGKTKGNAGTGHGNPYLGRALGEAAIGASRTKTFLGERYRRIAKRRGKKRAMVAIERSMLTIVWQLLSDPQKTFVDLGADFFDRRVNTNRAKNNHIRQLEALGYKVTLEAA